MNVTMSLYFIFIYKLFCLILCNAIPGMKNVTFAEDNYESSHGTIIFSAMLFRHGDRYAMSDFKTNPHSKYMLEAGPGSLTNTGKNRAYNLGLWARKRYNNLIKDTPYYSELLNMISSTSERAFSTGQLFLAGFYPPTSDEEEIWNKDLLWQPIPIFTDDRLLKMGHSCPRYNLEIERIKLSPQMQEFHNQYRESFSYIEKHREKEIPKDDPIIAIQKASAFYDTLYVQDQLNLKHPSWVSEIYPKGKNDVQAKFFELHTYNHQMARLKAAPLLEHIINELKNKRKNPQQEKLFQFYSGHDSNLIAILNALGVWDKKSLPAYCAALMFELRKLENDFIVTIMYRESSDVSLKLLKIPNCRDPCTLDSFIEATKSVIPKDLNNECKFFVPDYNAVLF